MLNDNNKPKTVTSFLDEIASDICDHYCKWPEKYGVENDDLDKLSEEHCNSCPLNKL